MRLGRDYVPTFWNFAFYDPFGMFGVASASNLNFAGTTGPAVSAVRNSNSVGYLVNSAAFEGRAGWYGQLQYAFGENASGTAKSSDGQTWSGLIGYASGPWNGSIGYTKTKMLANNDFTLANAGASWDFKVVKAMVEYSVANSGIAGTRYTTYLVGAQIPVGLGYIPALFSCTVSRWPLPRPRPASGSHRMLPSRYAVSSLT